MNSPALDIAAAAQPTTAAARTSPLPRWLDYALTGCLVLLAIAAPNSIAATQVAWGVGLLVWIVRFALRPRPRVERTPVDYALLGFFIITLVSALCSYDPDVSIGKLRAASLFTIVYLVAENVRTRRLLRVLALLLIAACMASVVYTFAVYAVGHGVKITGLTADSPLRRYGFRAGDTLLTADGHALKRPADLTPLLADTSAAPPVHLTFYRHEFVSDALVPRGGLRAGDTSTAQLGLTSWTRGRDERAHGFYGHYTTYAEALQLIIALATGLFVAHTRRRTRAGLLLALAVAGMATALLLTVTRASWLACLVSCGVVVLAGVRSRRARLAFALGALLVVPLALYVLREKRQVGFIDQSDGSITWRETVYREGLRLLVSKPRHLVVGVGMDSLKRHWREWGLFDQGRLPWGHMHSTPLQIALERGLPALAVWLALLFIYARMLRRLLHAPALTDWRERGITLGALGGLCGFCVSGLVHYNLGDSEVVMIFYLIMGLALAVERFTHATAEDAAATDAAATSGA